MRGFVLGMAVAVPAMVASLSASAVPVTVSSNGTLGSITNCGNPDTCEQNGSNQIYWGGGIGFFFGIPFNTDPSLSTSSVLTVTDNAGINDSDGLNVLLGQLTWINRTTPDSRTDDLFNVVYSVVNTFIAPTGTGSISNTLTIQNTLNPSPDLIINFNPASYTANIPGYSLENIHFEVTGGSSSYNAGTGTWTNPEGNTSTLTLRGDVTAVPEPASLAIVGMGLLGLGLVRRRRA